MTGIIQKALAFARKADGRVFAVAVLTVALAFTVICTPPGVKTAQPEEEISENTNVSRVSGYYSKTGELTTERAFAVRIICDSRKDVFMVTGGTVKDVLAMAGVELGEFDEVDWPLERVCRENDTITVTRKEIVTQTDETELPFETVEIPTSLLSAGKEEVVIEGQPGLHVKTYEETIIDGETTNIELLDEQVVQKPVRARVLVGDPGAPVSDLDFGYELDESGEPLDYVDVLRGQRASGYSAVPGAKTAGGYDAAVGYVAVNPSVIPYGTRLYIKSTDGRFVYGYAIAADTGIALRNGRVGVDLFYDTYLESCLNAIRNVDIFILE